MSKNIFVELRSGYNYLSKVEKAIADVILRDPKRFVTSSTAELAAYAGVSQGSINNFSKKFSTGGFSALKLRVAGCIPEEREETLPVIDPSISVKAAMELKIKRTAAALQHTMEINGEEDLQKAAALLLAAKKVQVYGVYYSGISGNDFCYHLIQLGIPAAFVSDMLMCAVSASMLDETGLVIAVSASGRTKEVIDAARIARESGAPVICLTNDRFSPLAAMSDVVLMTASDGFAYSDSTDEVRMAQHLVLDTLCSYICARSDVSLIGSDYRIKEILRSHSIED